MRARGCLIREDLPCVCVALEVARAREVDWRHLPPPCEPATGHLRYSCPCEPQAAAEVKQRSCACAFEYEYMHAVGHRERCPRRSTSTAATTLHTRHVCSDGYARCACHNKPHDATRQNRNQRRHLFVALLLPRAALMLATHGAACGRRRVQPQQGTPQQVLRLQSDRAVMRQHDRVHAHVCQWSKRLCIRAEAPRSCLCDRRRLGRSSAAIGYAEGGRGIHDRLELCQSLQPPCSLLLLLAAGAEEVTLHEMW